MQVVRTPGSARAIARTLARPCGFVPTMGALHAGHQTLFARAKSENASVVASIFVNPLQFAPGEDYERYPRAYEADVERLRESGVDLLYAPTADRLYGQGFDTRVEVGALGTLFEGAVRPGHFSGVATVVVKLVNAVEPTTLYLGQKDAQQVAVLRQVFRDLDLAPAIAVCPTARDADGLALSSRNAYLGAQERAAASSLNRALEHVVHAVNAGETKLARILNEARALLAAPLVWEYCALVDPVTFKPFDRVRRPALAIGVARAGTTRLLDNQSIPDAAGNDVFLTPPRPRNASHSR